MSTNQHRRRGGIALGVAGVALAGSVLFAAPASAHTPNWSVDCDSVSVSLKWYAKQGNTVTISAGGEQLLHQEFGASFHKQDLALPEHSEPLEVTVTVDASDHDRFDFSESKTSPVCEGEEPQPEPSTSEPTEPSPEPSTSEPTEPSPEPSTSEPPVEPTEEETAPPTEDLAETGSSSSTPLIAGIAAAVVAAGAGLLVVARKRRAAQS